MKLAVALTGLSVVVMVVMIFQTVTQELNLRTLKSRMLANSAEVKRREDSIVDMRKKIQEMKTTLVTVNTNIDELKKKKADSEKSTQELDTNLQSCHKELENAEAKKTEKVEAMAKLKADHKEAKNKAEVDIQNLKQQILDRDKAICAFADTTKEEARKLCGIAEASQ